MGPQRRLYGVHEVDGTRILESYRWGLVPSWAKDPKVGNKLFNARGETVTEKPSFRSAFAKRPLVIPVDAFYEWDHRPGKNKQPNLFTRADGNPLLLAGLFEYWRNPETRELVDATLTCTIITTEPNDDMDEIHNRMPVVLELDDVDMWLNVDEPPDGREVSSTSAGSERNTHASWSRFGCR